ncbi:hypothetical protein Scep_001862 [Stephania cephalantha]|uniref:Uncharacterized protein n=1 Tax=Stephania cephalantha TaxID=152367 RepID=A0AAP0L913_9MAGN
MGQRPSQDLSTLAKVCLVRAKARPCLCQGMTLLVPKDPPRYRLNRAQGICLGSALLVPRRDLSRAQGTCLSWSRASGKECAKARAKACAKACPCLCQGRCQGLPVPVPRNVPRLVPRHNLVCA